MFQSCVVQYPFSLKAKSNHLAWNWFSFSTDSMNLYWNDINKSGYNTFPSIGIRSHIPMVCFFFLKFCLIPNKFYHWIVQKVLSTVHRCSRVNTHNLCICTSLKTRGLLRFAQLSVFRSLENKLDEILQLAYCLLWGVVARFLKVTELFTQKNL